MADNEVDVEAVAALRKKRQFRKFTFRGLELERLLDLSHEELLGFVTARARRRMQRGLKRKPMALIKKLRKAKAGKCSNDGRMMEVAIFIFPLIYYYHLFEICSIIASLTHALFKKIISSHVKLNCSHWSS